MKNYFTPNTIICKKIKQQDVKKLEPLYTGGRKECQMVQVLWKTVWCFLKKLNMELPYDQEIPFLGIYWKEWNTRVQIKLVPECS